MSIKCPRTCIPFSLLFQVYNHTAEIEDSLNYQNIRMLFSKLVTADTPQDDVILQHSWIKPTKGGLQFTLDVHDVILRLSGFQVP